VIRSRIWIPAIDRSSNLPLERDEESRKTASKDAGSLVTAKLPILRKSANINRSSNLRSRARLADISARNGRVTAGRHRDPDRYEAREDSWDSVP